MQKRRFLLNSRGQCDDLRYAVRRASFPLQGALPAPYRTKVAGGGYGFPLFPGPPLYCIASCRFIALRDATLRPGEYPFPHSSRCTGIAWAKTKPVRCGSAFLSPFERRAAIFCVPGRAFRKLLVSAFQHRLRDVLFGAEEWRYGKGT